MMKPIFVMALAFLLIVSPLALAQEQAAPPPPPMLDDSGEGLRELLEPEITIIERDGETIHEKRINGQLYMIRVVPQSGPAYYLVDLDGDGVMDVRGHELNPRLHIPAWVLFSF
ncbi:Protein of unknown function [Ectothiorhodosinus mongolicus]|uniref:DUF2782 domain-containing protein n=1 Tax=Ectothiorhodosinus mongolicus TaxID=233100 RepID=A0A1R3VWI6_9GAMM|nr:Protein of unknown function [Ectothiorhodosinus mongolicus]